MRYGQAHITEVAGYHLAERIGSGGMGDVFKAYNNSLNRAAAVKILHQQDMAERFKNEAYIQSSITHPNIARLYEFIECGDSHCIIMEYVEGESLDSLLHRKGKLANDETENIIRQIVSALAYLHKKDIMHRDIKPQNFKIQADGTVKMLDFGIAKHKYSPKFTQQGFIVGTTEYLAPEQFQQQPELKSDVWALAVMTYELLTGYMPFEASNMVLLQSKIRKGNFTDPRILIPQISDKLLLLIEKGLKVNPANRISASEIASLLGKIKHTTGIAWLEPLKQLNRKIKIGVGAGIVLLLVVVLIANNDDAPPPPEEGTNVPAEKKEISSTGPELNISINTPGIAGAKLVLSTGNHHQLPYTVSGKEGDKFNFTIHADGYKDKVEEVILTPRRLSYEYNLEKNN